MRSKKEEQPLPAPIQDKVINEEPNKESKRRIISKI